MSYDTLTVDRPTRHRHPVATSRTKRLARKGQRRAARMTLADWMIYE